MKLSPDLRNYKQLPLLIYNFGRFTVQHLQNLEDFCIGTTLETW